MRVVVGCCWSSLRRTRPGSIRAPNEYAGPSRALALNGPNRLSSGTPQFPPEALRIKCHKAEIVFLHTSENRGVAPDEVKFVDRRLQVQPHVLEADGRQSRPGIALSDHKQTTKSSDTTAFDGQSGSICLPCYQGIPQTEPSPKWLYATRRGWRPLIRAVDGVFHATPEWSNNLRR
jgi:hypothetical protein